MRGGPRQHHPCPLKISRMTKTLSYTRFREGGLRISRIYRAEDKLPVGRRTEFPPRRGTDRRVCLSLQRADRPPGEASRHSCRHPEIEHGLRRLWLPRPMRSLRQGVGGSVARHGLRDAGATGRGLIARRPPVLAWPAFPIKSAIKNKTPGRDRRSSTGLAAIYLVVMTAGPS